MATPRKISSKKIKESDLYPPVKALLMQQGYEVKGEVKGCDVLAVRDDLLLAVELKLTLNLLLLLQANERAESVDFVYIAILKENSFYKSNRRALLKLLRKLGCGLIVVSSTFCKAETVLDPGVYAPRKQLKKRGRLLKEFHELVGDPNAGGSASKVKRVTVYRQKAVRIARYLLREGTSKAKDVRDALQIENARDIMYQNHYGWFDGQGKGLYGLSERGMREMVAWNELVQ
ncbi:MAG: DUF2161 domain-containing phosphodiesterase [Deltaproteobacteria bacterium]|nr:DUF2161 domain-containing phosphodiesterase [Deltaproteobacteria bacterium]